MGRSSGLILQGRLRLLGLRLGGCHAHPLLLLRMDISGKEGGKDSPRTRSVALPRRRAEESTCSGSPHSTRDTGTTGEGTTGLRRGSARDRVAPAAHVGRRCSCGSVGGQRSGGSSGRRGAGGLTFNKSGSGRRSELGGGGVEEEEVVVRRAGGPRNAPPYIDLDLRKDLLACPLATRCPTPVLPLLTHQS